MSIDLNTAVARAAQLPPRQRAVLVCLGRGLLIKETAAQLRMAENTVRATRAVLYRKLGVANATEAVRVACGAKLV